MYESLDGNCKKKTGSWCHMLGTQISPIQGFCAILLSHMTPKFEEAT